MRDKHLQNYVLFHCMSHKYQLSGYLLKLKIINTLFSPRSIVYIRVLKAFPRLLYPDERCVYAKISSSGKCGLLCNFKWYAIIMLLNGVLFYC